MLSGVNQDYKLVEQAIWQHETQLDFYTVKRKCLPTATEKLLRNLHHRAAGKFIYKPSHAASRVTR
jgi:hypothetical protein